MRIESLLKEIGLSEGERKVYLALLKLGSVKVSEIKRNTGLHRTTVYDFLEKLLNKGLVNSVVKEHVNYYNAAHPERLLVFVKEKEDNIREAMPELLKLVDTKKDEIAVETYRGVEGFKTLLNDALKVRKNYVAFGVDEDIFREKFGIIMDQHFRKEQEIGISSRLLTWEKAPFIYKVPNTSYRSIPKEFFEPTPTIIYGDRVGIMIWDPLTIIIITNRALAESYRKHFELLWKIGKAVKKR